MKVGDRVIINTCCDPVKGTITHTGDGLLRVKVDNQDISRVVRESEAKPDLQGS
jgi:hypothetical protein